MSDFGYLFLQVFLPSLAYQLPVLIVLLVGLILAIVRWRKDPRISLLTLLAIVLVAGITIIGVFTNSVLPYILYDNTDLDYSTIGIIFSVVSVVFNIGTAVSWVLLLIALFGKRKEKASAVEP
jgi:hypothetical protein